MRGEPTGLNWLTFGEDLRVQSSPGGVAQPLRAGATLAVGMEVELDSGMNAVPLGTSGGAATSAGVVIGGKLTRYTCCDRATEVGIPAATAGQTVLVCIFGIVYKGSTPFDAFKTLVAPSPSVSRSEAGAVQRSLADKLQDKLTIRDFGAKIDGIHDDAPATSAAIAAARLVGGTVVVPAAPPGKIVWNEPVDMTVAAGEQATKAPIRLVHEGSMSLGPGDGSGSAGGRSAIVVNHDSLAVDMTGAYDCVVDSLNCTSGPGVSPTAMLFMARNTSGGNAGINSFYNCRGYGKFTKAMIYSYGSEVNNYFGCHMFNKAPNAVIFKSTATNIDGLVSSRAGIIASGTQSNLCSNFFGGGFQAIAAGGKIWYLEQHDRCQVYGVWSCPGDAAVGAGHSHVYVDMSVGPSNFCSLQGIVGENAGAGVPQYGVFFTNHAQSPLNFRINGCHFPHTVNAVYGGPLVAPQAFEITQLTEDVANNGIKFENSLTTSTIDFTGKIALTHDVFNHLIGFPSNWTIGDRTGSIHLSRVTGALV